MKKLTDILKVREDQPKPNLDISNLNDFLLDINEKSVKEKAKGIRIISTAKNNIYIPVTGNPLIIQNALRTLFEAGYTIQVHDTNGIEDCKTNMGVNEINFEPWQNRESYIPRLGIGDYQDEDAIARFPEIWKRNERIIVRESQHHPDDKYDLDTQIVFDKRIFINMPNFHDFYDVNEGFSLMSMYFIDPHSEPIQRYFKSQEIAFVEYLQKMREKFVEAE